MKVEQLPDDSWKITEYFKPKPIIGITPRGRNVFYEIFKE